MTTYSIGEFSKKCGLSIDTLRYYEKEHLIYCQRDSNNRRCYDETDIKWIEFILRLKQTGMSIKDMKVYAHLRYQGNDTIPERLNLLFQQLEQLYQQQREINNHINFLKQKIILYQELLDNPH